MAAKTTERWASENILEAIQTIHPGPDQWIVVTEVPNATGFGKNRSADAIAFSCWPSNGLGIHGYEVKVARSDWLREIQDPSKGAEFVKRCNYWWIIAPEGVVKVEEMPADWGLKVVKRNGTGGYSVRVKKAATHNTAATIDISFLCAAIRCAWKRSPEGHAFDKQIADAFERGYEAGKKSSQRVEVDHYKRPFDHLAEAVRKFEAESGLSISSGWRAGEIGAAVRAFQKLGNPTEAYRSLIESLETMLDNARKCCEVIGGSDV